MTHNNKNQMKASRSYQKLQNIDELHLWLKLKTFQKPGPVIT